MRGEANAMRSEREDAKEAKTGGDVGGEANAMRSKREDAKVADPPRLSKRSKNDDWKSDTFAASQELKPQKGAGKRKRKERDKDVESDTEDGKRARGQPKSKSATAVKVDEDDDDGDEDEDGGDDDSDGKSDEDANKARDWPGQKSKLEDDDVDEDEDDSDGAHSSTTAAQVPTAQVPASLESEFQQSLLFDGFLHLCELNVHGATKAINGKLAKNPIQFVILPEPRFRAFLPVAVDGNQIDIAVMITADQDMIVEVFPRSHRSVAHGHEKHGVSQRHNATPFDSFNVKRSEVFVVLQNTLFKIIPGNPRLPVPFIIAYLQSKVPQKERCPDLYPSSSSQIAEIESLQFLFRNVEFGYFVCNGDGEEQSVGGSKLDCSAFLPLELVHLRDGTTTAADFNQKRKEIFIKSPQHITNLTAWELARCLDIVRHNGRMLENWLSLSTSIQSSDYETISWLHSNVEQFADPPNVLELIEKFKAISPDRVLPVGYEDLLRASLMPELELELLPFQNIGVNALTPSAKEYLDKSSKSRNSYYSRIGNAEQVVLVIENTGDPVLHSSESISGGSPIMEVCGVISTDPADTSILLSLNNDKDDSLYFSFGTHGNKARFLQRTGTPNCELKLSVTDGWPIVTLVAKESDIGEGEKLIIAWPAQLITESDDEMGPFLPRQSRDSSAVSALSSEMTPDSPELALSGERMEDDSEYVDSSVSDGDESLSVSLQQLKVSSVSSRQYSLDDIAIALEGDNRGLECFSVTGESISLAFIFTEKWLFANLKGQGVRAPHKRFLLGLLHRVYNGPNENRLKTFVEGLTTSSFCLFNLILHMSADKCARFDDITGDGGCYYRAIVAAMNLTDLIRAGEYVGSRCQGFDLDFNIVEHREKFLVQIKKMISTLQFNDALNKLDPLWEGCLLKHIGKFEKFVAWVEATFPSSLAAGSKPPFYHNEGNLSWGTSESFCQRDADVPDLIPGVLLMLFTSLNNFPNRSGNAAKFISTAHLKVEELVFGSPASFSQLISNELIYSFYSGNHFHFFQPNIGTPISRDIMLPLVSNLSKLILQHIDANLIRLDQLKAEMKIKSVSIQTSSIHLDCSEEPIADRSVSWLTFAINLGCSTLEGTMCHSHRGLVLLDSCRIIGTEAFQEHLSTLAVPSGQTIPLSSGVYFMPIFHSCMQTELISIF